MMKYIFLFITILLSISCNIEYDKKVNFYKNQYRDPNLFGKWSDINHTYNYRVLEFDNNAKSNLYINGKISTPFMYYYTKDSLLYKYQKYGYYKALSEIYKYKISNDTLYTLEYNTYSKKYFDDINIYVRMSD